MQTLILRHNHLSCERQSDCAFTTSSDAPLPHLRYLDLSDNLLTSGEDQDGGAGLRLAANVFPGLLELDLTGNRLTAIVVGAFGSLTRLQTLRLSDNPLTGVESGALDGLAALTKLEMDRCGRLTHLRAGALAGLNKLRTFSARDSGLVHLHHVVFAHLTHLEELHLRNNRLGDQVQSHLIHVTIFYPSARTIFVVTFVCRELLVHVLAIFTNAVYASVLLSVRHNPVLYQNCLTYL